MKGPGAVSIAMVVLLAGCGPRDEPPPTRPAGEPASNTNPMPATPPPVTPPPADAPAVSFEPAGRPVARVTVELAISEHDVQRGLMYREHMAPDGGMIFLFREPKVQRFWMKNTLLPLDMIFVGSDRVVVGVVENAEPKTLDSRSVDGESQFVVEVNAGWAKAHGVGAGTRAVFEHIPVERAVAD